jgi:hypothetical protein
VSTAFPQSTGALARGIVVPAGRGKVEMAKMARYYPGVIDVRVLPG